ncbi:WD40 repeat domain-containing protein [Phormidium tenue FACHB-886]|nr:WD40 repeat domain-containing protein [Phormidium tenue FACHB-886]
MLFRSVGSAISLGLVSVWLPVQPLGSATPAFTSAFLSSQQPTTQQFSQQPNAAADIIDPSWQPGTVTLDTISDPNGSSSPVRSVVFSPDGRYLFSGGADKAIRVWNLQARSLERVLSPSSDQISEIAISPDGRLLASASLDGTVKVWDWRNGRLLNTLAAHSDVVTSVKFSPDGQVLGSASADKTIRLWDVETGALERTISTNQWIEAIAFSSDGSTIASAGLERVIELWNWQTGRPIRTLTGYASAIYAIAFSPDGQTLAFSPNSRQQAAQNQTAAQPESNTIYFVNLAGKQVGQPLRGHSDYITSLAFSPSGRTLISGSWDNTAKIWNVQTGEVIRDFSERTERILAVSFRLDGRAFALGSGDGTINVFRSDE